MSTIKEPHTQHINSPQPPNWWISIILEEMAALQQLVDLTAMTEAMQNCVLGGLWSRTAKTVTNLQNAGIELLPDRVRAFVVSTFYEQLSHCQTIYGPRP